MLEVSLLPLFIVVDDVEAAVTEFLTSDSLKSEAGGGEIRVSVSVACHVQLVLIF